MVTPAEKRSAVAHLVATHGMGERRACKATGSCRMTVRGEATRPDDRVLREWLTELARERRRFGYRRLHVLLRHEGLVVNHEKPFMLYHEERLGWQTPAEFARTIPRRETALRNPTSSAPSPAAHPAPKGNHNRRSELGTG